MATFYPAKALNLELGEIKTGKIADFSVFEIGDLLTRAENSAFKDKNLAKKGKNSADNGENLANNLRQLPLQFILNAKFAKKLFIAGKECEI